jgi:hypothetical protein
MAFDATSELALRTDASTAEATSIPLFCADYDVGA